MSTKPLDTPFAPLFPGMDDNFGIAVCPKYVAARLQLRNEVDEVVDFPVKHHDHAAVFVEQRLLAARHVDDRQPSMSETDAGLQVNTALIGATMKLNRVHASEQRFVYRTPGFHVKDAGYSAHSELSR